MPNKELEKLLVSFATYEESSEQPASIGSRKRTSAGRETGFYCDSRPSTSKAPKLKQYIKEEIPDFDALEDKVKNAEYEKDQIKQDKTMTPEKRKTELNRHSAIICRERKKRSAENNETKAQHLENENEELRKELEAHKKVNTKLQNIIKTGQCLNCQQLLITNTATTENGKIYTFL